MAGPGVSCDHARPRPRHRGRRPDRLDLLAGRGIAATALVLEPAGDLRAARVVTGDAGDPAVAGDALRDADAVIHLAAIPHPENDPGEVVFGPHDRHRAGRR